MPSAQGKHTSVFIPGKMCGVDENGAPTSNNSQDYRGRPYTLLNKIDQMAMDHSKEQSKISRQKGLRVLALYLTTSQNPIQ